MLLPTFKNLLNNLPFISCFYRVSYLRYDDSAALSPVFPLSFKSNENAFNEFIDEFLQLTAVKKLFRSVSLTLSLGKEGLVLLKWKRQDPSETKTLKMLVAGIVALSALIWLLTAPYLILMFVALAVLNHVVMEKWLNQQESWGAWYLDLGEFAKDTATYMHNNREAMAEEVQANIEENQHITTRLMYAVSAAWDRYVCNSDSSRRNYAPVSGNGDQNGYGRTRLDLNSQ